MGLRLVERALCKHYANLPVADQLFDPQFNGMIEEASDQAQRFCDRTFTYGTYRDFAQSYNQDHFDPVGQYMWALAFPIDLTQPTTLVYAPYDLHDQAGITLIPQTDYLIQADKGLFTIRKASGIIQTILPLVLARPIFSYAPRGFRLDYTGGYPVSVPPAEGYTPDPLDDFGVVQVPAGLKAVLARKIARDWKKSKQLEDWSEDERRQLRPYKRQSKLFGSP